MSWTIKKKMLVMGLVALIALAALAGMNFVGYRTVDMAMGNAASQIKEMEAALGMKAAQLELVLASVESIVDRHTGKISEEKMSTMKKTSSALNQYMKEIMGGIHNQDEAAFLSGIAKNIEALDRIIQKDLVDLIEGSAKRLGEIDQKFKKIQMSLREHSQELERAINSFEGALGLSIAMAANEEEATIYKSAIEFLNLIHRTVNNLVIAGLESIVERETGVIAEKTMRVINGWSEYLQQNVPNLSDYARSDEHKGMVKKIQDESQALTRLITGDLVTFITKGAAESSNIRDAFNKVKGDLNRSGAEVASMLDRVANTNRTEAEEAIQSLQSTQKMTFYKGMGVAVIALVVLAAVILIVSTGINRVLGRTSQRMKEGSLQIASAAGQVASASQSLAKGASEQAASIEETSSSLEEMSSMTKQNADHAAKADALMKDTKQVVGEANASMGNLTDAMQAISQASAETQKIVKTIDEIAFQTNLLALNAAVEAARAGESGAGFAVVAGEVRNLAMRASEAAKNTADLIHSTVQRVEQGSNLLKNTNESFTKLSQSSSKVGEILSEIVAASSEQSRGIEQINRAVAEMDKVVQQNAANAEESASASEEMHAQAEQMREAVGDLETMIYGCGSRVEEESDLSGHENVSERSDLVQSKVLRMPAHGRKALSSGDDSHENVIPLDEEFKNF